MECPKCSAPAIKNGTDKQGRQKFVCKNCGYNFPADKGSISVNLHNAEITKSVGLSEAQLRAKFDLRFIVESKCKELKEGNFLTLAEFIQLCGIRPGAGYRGIIDHPDYEKYHGKAGGTSYWSHPASIKKLKDEGVLL